MSLDHEPATAAQVEWLAGLWELTEGRDSRSANPDLLTLLRFSPGLTRHPAFECVARLRKARSRDRLIKELVSASYSAHGELYDATHALLAEVEDLIGIGPHAVIEQARATARQRVLDLAGVLDPAADLAEITGERLPLRVVVSPSVFLPPPQAGRHGVLIRQGDEWIVHLHFGYPLRQDPRQFSITQPWLLGGAWHYAIQLYLDRCWPLVAHALDADPELPSAVRAALESSSEHGEQSWTEMLKMHINVALKCLLSRRLNVPDGVHRAFARARGLVLFPWFEEWLVESGAQGTALAEHITTLPAALASTRTRWERIAKAWGGTPPTVNLALISSSSRRASMVVPDDWSERAIEAAVAGWRLLPLPVVRHREWMQTPSRDTNPVIAFGEPERNALVQRVLDQRGLNLQTVQAADPAIIALSQPGLPDASWCIAVAVTRPEAAAALHIEMALNHTTPYIVFDGTHIVQTGVVPPDEFYASPNE